MFGGGASARCASEEEEQKTNAGEGGCHATAFFNGGLYRLN
jgi:hypothetical protein